MNPEGHCKPQEFNGVCNVFNCPWVEFNTEETNSHQVSFPEDKPGRGIDIERFVNLNSV